MMSNGVTASRIYRTASARSRRMLLSPSSRAKRHSTGPGKEVETARSLYVSDILYDIKNVFTRKVGGGSRCDICRHVETATSVFSSDYSHNGVTIKSKGARMASLPARNICGGNIEGMTRDTYLRSTGVTSSRIFWSPVRRISSL